IYRQVIISLDRRDAAYRVSFFVYDYVVFVWKPYKVLVGFLAMNVFRLFANMFISRLLASNVAQPLWGVMRQFLAPSKGLLAGGGSTANTSIPAALMRPSFRASARSAALISPPLEVLIMIAEDFIIAKLWLLMIFSVCGVWGQC